MAGGLPGRLPGSAPELGGVKNKKHQRGRKSTITFDHYPPRVCEKSDPFQKSYVVGGVTTRRFFDDDITVTKDQPRTKFPHTR